MPDPAPHGLTPMQLQAMQVIQELTDASGGVPPSYADLVRELSVSSRASIHRIITGLEERGFISRIPHRARTIAIRQRVPMPDFTPFEWLPGPSLGGQVGVGHG